MPNLDISSSFMRLKFIMIRVDGNFLVTMKYILLSFESFSCKIHVYNLDLFGSLSEFFFRICYKNFDQFKIKNVLVTLLRF